MNDLVSPLTPDDIVIDGGNSYYRDGMRRAAELKAGGIHYLDVGTSGGVAGLGDAEEGFLHCGPHGAGDFVKMIHNGIEYGMMVAYAESFNILRNANVGTQTHDKDAETTPLHNPEFYNFDINLPEIAEVWRCGNVIGSWLLDLTAEAFHKNPDSTPTAAASRIPARAAGRSRGPSTNGSLRMFLAPRCSRVLFHAVRPIFQPGSVRNAQPVRWPC